MTIDLSITCSCWSLLESRTEVASSASIQPITSVAEPSGSQHLTTQRSSGTRAGQRVALSTGHQTRPFVAGPSMRSRRLRCSTGRRCRMPFPSAPGFSFPDPNHPGLTPLVVRLTTDSLRFVVDADKSTYSAQVAVVIRLKDSQGKDVQKLSQRYILSGDVKDMEAARRGTILFYREPLLAPGVSARRIDCVRCPLLATGAPNLHPYGARPLIADARTEQRCVR